MEPEIDSSNVKVPLKEYIYDFSPVQIRFTENKLLPLSSSYMYHLIHSGA